MNSLIIYQYSLELINEIGEISSKIFEIFCDILNRKILKCDDQIFTENSMPKN